MGYSLSVPCKSVKAAEMLHAFLTSELRPFSIACDDPANADIRTAFEAVWEGHEEDVQGLPSEEVDLPYDPTQYVHIGRGLSYAEGTTKVGFNFSTQMDFGVYMHTVLAWAALRVGRRRGLNALAPVGHADQKVPYFTYDSEPTEVSRKHGEIYWQVGPLGLRVTDEDGVRTHRFGQNVDAVRKRIRPDERFDWLRALAIARDTALRAVTEREMRRLDCMWDYFVDMETR